MKLSSLIGGLLCPLALTSGCTVPSLSGVRQYRDEPMPRGEAARPAPNSTPDATAYAPAPKMPSDDTPSRLPIDLRSGKEASPRSAKDFTARGIERAERGRLDESIADFDEAVRLDPKDARARMVRAIIRQRVGRLDQALSDADAAVQLDPARAEGFATRAGIRVAKGNVPKALEDYDVAIRLDPENTAYYETRSSFRLLLGDRSGALKDLDAVIRLDPSNALARSERESILTAFSDARSRDAK